MVPDGHRPLLDVGLSCRVSGQGRALRAVCVADSHVPSHPSGPTQPHECPLGTTGRLCLQHSGSPRHSMKPPALGEGQSMQVLSMGVSANVQLAAHCVIEGRCSLCSCLLPFTWPVGSLLPKGAFFFPPFPHAVLGYGRALNEGHQRQGHRP